MLLIIDETCYLPMTKDQANLFFQVIVKRYEKGSGIVFRHIADIRQVLEIRYYVSRFPDFTLGYYAS